MKKQAKAKSKPAKRVKSEAEAPEVTPDLVAAMTKLVERLESVERKMDQVIGRVSSLPNEIRNLVQQNRPTPPQQHAQPRPQQQNPQSGTYFQQSSQPQRPSYASTQGQNQTQNQNNGSRQRPVFQAVCADCKKNCEVPFKPSDRPVYCKECFAARKSKSSAPAPQMSARSIASAYVNKKAGYPPPQTGYRPQASLTAQQGNTAVMKPEKRIDKPKGKKKK